MPTLFDAHVHLYPKYNLEKVILGSLNTLLCIRKDKFPLPTFALFLTERSSENRFLDLLNFKSTNITATLVDGGLAIQFTQKTSQGSVSVYVVSGKQLVSKERIEIHALGTTKTFVDGRSLQEIILNLKGEGMIPVLPWSPGKWMGERGRIIKKLIEGSAKGDLLLSDPAMRPCLFPSPPLFHLAAQKGIRTIFGTDPFPLPNEEKRIGQYATYTHAELSPSTPGKFISEIANNEGCHPQPAGHRLSPIKVAWRLFALSRSKRI